MVKAPTRPIDDWVKRLDEEIRQDPGAVILRSAFHRARYARLWAKRLSTSSPFARDSLGSDTEFSKRLESHQSTLTEVRALRKLSREQQRQLIGLVIDISEAYKSYAFLRTPVRRELQMVKKGPPLVRKIRRALIKAKIPLEQAAILVEELYKISPGAYPFRLGITSAHDAVSKTVAEMSDYDLTQGRVIPLADPINDATLKLVAFFVYQCGLPRNDAYVRTQKIGTAYWEWTGEFTESYDGVTGWKDAPAVRKRISRRRPKDT